MKTHLLSIKILQNLSQPSTFITSHHKQSLQITTINNYRKPPSLIKNDHIFYHTQKCIIEIKQILKDKS